MRFNWRRRLVVTAFAAVSMLPFAGCSSQQQQQGMDEVTAQGQQGEGEEGGDQTAQVEGQEGEAQNGNNAAMAEQSEGNNAVENTEGGQNVVMENQAAAAEGSTNGDLQEIISEMSGNPAEGQVADAAGEPAAPVAADPAVAGNVPMDASAGAPVAAAQGPAMSAPVASAAPGMPELGSKMAYVVEPGDTLGKIAAKIYGDQKRWRDIAGLSGLDNPNHIYPGDLIYYSLDDSSKNFASTYESVRRSKEVVREGDTLAAISKRVYGKSNLWKHIWRQNDNIDNPDVLTAGMNVYYIESGSMKTAMKKIKSHNAAKTAAKKLSKTPNLMTQAHLTILTAV